MTERTQSASSLRDNPEEQYRLLTENVKDFAIFLLDTGGKIATWNTGAERITGFKEAEAIEQPFALLFRPQDIINREPEKELRIAAETGRSEDERWHIRKNGGQFWAMGVVTPLWDDNGKLRGYAKIMRDITDRKRAETELAEANRRKDDFLAMLAHELRNPLAPVLNGLQILRLEQKVSPGGQEAIGIIDRQARHLARLVDDLLDISRITTGKVSLRKERGKLHTVVNHAVETVRPLMESRKHQLSVSLPSEAVWLEADPARLTQVLANLLNNAAKYTEPGGHVQLSAEREGSEVIVRFRDTGIGILPEMLPRIFESFVQGDRSIDRTQGGLGIGLTLAKSLVEMHGGKIEAHSPGVGKGSEFIVRLPAVPEVKPLEPEAVEKRQATKTPPLRLLVVDDNPDTVESLAMLLRMYGHDVMTADSGPAGLEAALAHDRNAILLDIGLPSIDGYEVARRIRAHTAKPVLIAMTGYGQPEDRQKSKEAGFDHHLTKPVDPDRLQDLLAKIGQQR
ncbi:MAG TPA: ATP-binding protein [Gemmataceae bacterium]|jgi:PAS domain S-box-containing protein